MHGNTYQTPESKIKTRNFDIMLEEVQYFVTILKEHGEVVGGLHLETAPELVTEVVGEKCAIMRVQE